MSEHRPPRVTVTLPDGTVVGGHLHARRQRPDGTWWYEVAVEVPAGAVTPVDGEKYDEVPTEREQVEVRYVVETLQPVDGKRRLELHVATCWALPGRMSERVTAVESAGLARAALGFEDTGACEVCRPGREGVVGGSCSVRRSATVPNLRECSNPP